VKKNELVTRVGPGDPDGGTCCGGIGSRPFLSREVPEPDCPPVRVQLLGEKLVGFRDSEGRIGLVDEFLPAPPRLAVVSDATRNPACAASITVGKFDVEGNCVDQMNEPEQFCHKVRLTSYPTTEIGGVIWAYMGPREKMPAPPAFEWTQVPETHRHVSKVWEECNWLQALEGGIDTSHAPILHRTITPKTSRPGIPVQGPFVRGKSPDPRSRCDRLRLSVRRDTPRSTKTRPMCALITSSCRFTQIRPQQLGRALGGGDRTNIAGHIWVPIDDENCMVWKLDVQLWRGGAE